MLQQPGMRENYGLSRIGTNLADDGILNANMDLGDALTRWSIRAALTVLVLCCAGRQLAGDNRRWQAIDRLLWPLGCALFLTHIAAAIYFFHHGSQAAAFADIANQTKEVLGAAVGEGLYVNYLMAVVWTADALWLAALPQSYRRRPAWIEGAVLGFFLFIAFNGTVIFKTGWLRVAGLVGTTVIAAALIWRGWRRHGHRADADNRAP
ncbi:hypothetical protein M4951_01060 [Blastopirellula sp. J2-11]|uniref:hypothetical protein n=1 Tax=Blastopirellula sp. J2-11 TaxID=2943192 RepID=UPI0021C5A2C8|nr:hypothetical protein [Blastopirellula sp. J2-11]UUO06917.1 hypothetical protein M4951_01060 [Blastopirellula sp. J2-11]